MLHTVLCTHTVASLYYCISPSVLKLQSRQYPAMYTNHMLYHCTVFCPGFQKSRVPSEKGTFSAVNRPSKGHHSPLSRRRDRCDRVIQNESGDPFGGNVYYITMQSTFLTRKFRNGERNLHCDVVHITTKWVSSLTLDCNGVFAIKAY